MQLDLSNIQESNIPYGYHQGKKIGEVPFKYFQEMREKAPNKRSLTEKLILKFIEEENDKVELMGKLSGQMVKLKVSGVDILTSLDKEREKKKKLLVERVGRLWLHFITRWSLTGNYREAIDFINEKDKKKKKNS